MDQMNNKVKTCIGCIYYYVTWDKSKPKGCKYFGFKSMQMPCTVVLKSSGERCNMYTKKGGEKR